MKETILGIDQAFAVEHGLDVVDVMLFAVVKDKMQSANTRKLKRNGKCFVWVSYQDVLEHLPILNIKKRRLAARMDAMCDKGVLEKYVDKEAGCYTYFRLSGKRQGVVAKETGGCRSADKGVVAGVTSKELPVNNIPESSKEKDITKVISKKKDGGDFEETFKEFIAKALEDNDFKYSLRGYKIKDYTALLVAFRAHVANLCKQGDFIDNGYVRNRTWLLRSMPYLDLGKATGYSLGYGEYLKDNRRWYRNRAGKEIEVPMDAPPRRQGTIWYKEQGRWGPDI